ncbi:MAG: hypothetical protein Q8Q29_00625 [Actinomycetota bacterium]|nr:hypothetical protein [Actinomycetota bacterium]
MSRDTYEAVLAWLDEALAKALVVDGPDGIAKAAWVPIDRVLLARDRLAVLIAQDADDLDATAPGNFL